MGHKYKFEYPLFFSADYDYFKKACFAIQDCIPKLTKEKLLTDEDCSQIQCFSLDGRLLIIKCDADFDEIYIYSDVDIESKIEEIKEHASRSDITHISFYVGGFTGFDQFSVSINKSGTAKFEHEGVQTRSLFPNQKTFSKDEAKEFLCSFESLGVYDWKRKYEPSSYATDGTSWCVEIERRGKRKFIREGYNSFPPQWIPFIRLFGMGLDCTKAIELNLSYFIGTKSVVEKVVIDYNNSTFTCTKTSDGEKVFHLFLENPDDLSDVDDEISYVIEFDWNDSAETEDLSPYFTLSVTDYAGRKVQHNCVYDSIHLPDGWEDVISSISQFIVGCDIKLTDTEWFYAEKSKNGKYIYCSVAFSEGGKTYYYRTDDISIKVGDRVAVPVGNDGKERIVTVEKIECFDEYDLPMPISKVKTIVGKIVDADKLECPLCQKSISADDCYEINMRVDGGGPKNGVPGLISRKTIDENKLLCYRCRYHLTDSGRPKLPFSEEDVLYAHQFSGGNKQALLNDKKCGCFYCLKIFDPCEIEEYIHDDNDCDRDGTAICPYCGIDSVIGESSGYPITYDFLASMKRKWF